jgi:hypothetical protein
MFTALLPGWFVLVMETVNITETSANFYHTARCHISEDSQLHEAMYLHNLLLYLSVCTECYCVWYPAVFLHLGHMLSSLSILEMPYVRKAQRYDVCCICQPFWLRLVTTYHIILLYYKIRRVYNFSELLLRFLILISYAVDVVLQSAFFKVFYIPGQN